MAQQDYSEHQQRIITKYYNHLDTIMLQKLQELVSELYLADTDTKRKRLWERVHKAMVNLQIPPDIVEHIMSRKDVKILAQNLEEWLRQSSQKG
jgi:intergrase/recombinase